jgi:hypothetical protein
MLKEKFQDGSKLLIVPNVLDPAEYGESQSQWQAREIEAALASMRHWVAKIGAMIDRPGKVTCGPLFYPITGERVERTPDGFKYVFDHTSRIAALSGRKEINFSCLADLARQKLDDRYLFKSLEVASVEQ